MLNLLGWLSKLIHRPSRRGKNRHANSRLTANLAFNSPLLHGPYTNLQGHPSFELAEPLTFRLRMGRGHICTTVPAGFVTDGASVPRILWPIFNPFGEYFRAAVMHDFLYSTAGDCSRFLADSLFREAMKELGVPIWRRVVMYYAVRAFGWMAFHWK